MKKQIIFTIICLTLTLFTKAQEITVPEPEFEGEIIFVLNNKAVELDATTTFMKKGQSVGRMMTGIGKSKARLVAKGSTSTAKIEQRDKLYFIYNNGSNAVKPTKIIQLLKFKQTNKTREYLVSSASNVSGQTETGVLDLIKFKAKKYGDSSYLISVSNLSPGEYAFFLGSVETYEGSFFTVTE